jgi:hypothetical protein
MATGLGPRNWAVASAIVTIGTAVNRIEDQRMDCGRIVRVMQRLSERGVLCKSAAVFGASRRGAALR